MKLLRVISEERAFERVGGNQTLRADVRLIAATNKNLEKLVAEGKFRDDLYFRLNVVHITMPPLRERKEDIPLLVRSFLRHFCKVNEKPLLELTADAMNALLTYSWPGNVRELRTAIEHGVVMAHGPKIELRDLPPNVRAATGAALPGGITPAKAFGEKSSALDLHETEKRLIMQALATTNGNITKAAQKARHQPADAASQDQRDETRRGALPYTARLTHRRFVNRRSLLVYGSATGLSISTVAQAKKIFGTDGVRGVANVEPVTAETALKLGRAAAHIFTKLNPREHPSGARPKIVLGKDTRLSGYMLENALVAGITSLGVDVC